MKGRNDFKIIRAGGSDMLGCTEVLALSKMARGKANVAQAFGTSTIPDILPSMGAQDRSKYICRSTA